MTRAVSAFVVLGLVACSTYDDRLLVGPPSPSAGSAGTPSGEAGAEPSAGDAGAAGSGEPLSEAGASVGGAASSEAGASSAGLTGGGSGSGGAGTVNGGAPGGGASSPSELIDDFEDQDGFVLPRRKRNGPWYVFADATVGKLDPLMMALVADTPSTAGSASALHLTASGFSDWGVGVGADFVNLAAKKLPYDVSAYRGVRFFARVGAGSQTTLKVLVPTTFSDAEGGKCSDSVAGEHCRDHLFRALTGLRTTWTEYEIDFTELTQQGFGLPQTQLDPTSVYGVQFTLVTKLLPADLWIDDVSFVVGRP